MAPLGFSGAGLFGAGVYGGDLDAALHRAHLVKVRLQQVEVPQLLFRRRRRGLHRSMVGRASSNSILPEGRVLLVLMSWLC